MRQFPLVLIFALFFSNAVARTWQVNADGSGDAPDLYAAMDSASTGDIVLVGPGHYGLPERLLVPSGVQLIGRDGPTATHIEALANDVFTSGVSLHERIEGIHLYGVSNLSVLSLHGAEVDNCIVEIVEGGGGLPSVISVNAPSILTRSLVANGTINVYSVVEVSYCIILADLEAPTACNCYTFFSNDVVGNISPNIPVSPGDLNFFLDPQFCGVPGSGNYYLKSTSPCLPENNPYGAPLSIGPLGIGCGAVSIETTTWGAIKAMYQGKQ